MARYNEPNPMEPETGAYIAAGVGVLLFAGMGYWLYTKSQASAQATSSPSSYPVVQTPVQAPISSTADYPVVQTLETSPLPVPPG